MKITIDNNRFIKDYNEYYDVNFPFNNLSYFFDGEIHDVIFGKYKTKKYKVNYKNNTIEINIDDNQGDLIKKNLKKIENGDVLKLIFKCDNKDGEKFHMLFIQNNKLQRESYFLCLDKMSIIPLDKYTTFNGDNLDTILRLIETEDFGWELLDIIPAERVNIEYDFN